jgi:hypothetical protein
MVTYLVWFNSVIWWIYFFTFQIKIFIYFNFFIWKNRLTTTWNLVLIGLGLIANWEIHLCMNILIETPLYHKNWTCRSINLFTTASTEYLAGSQLLAAWSRWIWSLWTCSQLLAAWSSNMQFMNLFIGTSGMLVGGSLAGEAPTFVRMPYKTIYFVNLKDRDRSGRRAIAIHTCNYSAASGAAAARTRIAALTFII